MFKIQSKNRIIDIGDSEKMRTNKTEIEISDADGFIFGTSLDKHDSKENYVSLGFVDETDSIVETKIIFKNKESLEKLFLAFNVSFNEFKGEE